MPLLNRKIDGMFRTKVQLCLEIIDLQQIVSGEKELQWITVLENSCQNRSNFSNYDKYSAE
uniref:Uncharacterized protein n=1 Tax=Octopus bimaculoides TaxID=37653 RepID=A0A0L8I3A6_OCTBM